MSDRLRKFKQTLGSKGDEIYNGELRKIINREPNIVNMRQNVAKQKEENPLAGEILDELYSHVRHIPAQKVFEDVLKMSRSAMESIRDKPFYIYLSKENAHCFTKSNMLFAIMTMAKNRTMLSNFEDFICNGKPLHGWYNPSVRHIMYIDDISFSGKQVRSSFEGLQRILSEVYGNVRLHFHMVLPYIGRTRRNTVIEQIIGRYTINWYHAFTDPKYPVRPILKQFIDEAENEIAEEKIVTIFEGLLGSSNFNLSLFYTDLKVADDSSIYPGFFLKPEMYMRSGEFVSDALLPIVTNCDVKDRGGSDEVAAGNYCPLPIYKKSRWIQTLRNTRILSSDDADSMSSDLPLVV